MFSWTPRHELCTTIKTTTSTSLHVQITENGCGHNLNAFSDTSSLLTLLHLLFGPSGETAPTSYLAHTNTHNPICLFEFDVFHIDWQFCVFLVELTKCPPFGLLNSKTGFQCWLDKRVHLDQSLVLFRKHCWPDKKASLKPLIYWAQCVSQFAKFQNTLPVVGEH